MNIRSFKRNDIFVEQGSPVTSFYLLKDGEVRREFLDPDSGKRHQIEFEIVAKSINTMRVLSGDPSHSSIKCNDKECTLFEMPRQRLMNVLLKKEPDIGVGIANSLTSHVRETSKKYRTPLLEHRQQVIQNVPAVMIAAGVESYYRSALNAQINYALTGVKSEMFPNMHIQVPMRIFYIAGFKGLRAYLDQYATEDESSDTGRAAEEHDAIANRNFSRRLGIALAPGVIMTPISSLLEASNAGHLNKEPMTTRWMRGITARCGREILFGLGLNQLSEYFQERWRFPDSPMLTNMVGSLMGGVVSGYLSHVPHNLSAYKLLEPHRSYADLYQNVFVERSVPPFLQRYLTRQTQMQGRGVAIDGAASGVVTFSGPQQAVRFIAATIFPRGLIVRTVQIVGSFMILNGTINYFTLMQLRQ
eukprot:CAMPEP_0201118204 /NCGR_PEP_ID=MMETSP0850-20130426/2322_1 /ASSEMBLY_ACC=CAM_ASM_000622 /TAXON_ID=183588 /ORGANISM="Pseudo-nitzschia fraudulenta, Strain WWA7" /LENGTH=416 /DNA_ID=CAMNT_0047383211 /DNA_START=26 /DNA_END=1276 /DNA_ORIENTATION=-